MGVRQDVKLVYEKKNEIYLYSHWDEANYLKNVIKEVLKRKVRWDDESYLARMIFSAMVKNDIDSETGYGLSPFEMGEGSPIVVDLVKKTVDGVSFYDFIAS